MRLMKRLHTYSQNFLKSPTLVHSLITRSDLKEGDIVYDLGAGSGVITSALAIRVTKVIAVEFEPRTVQLLRKNVAKFDNVTVLNEDVLKVNFPLTPYKVFANIPFHLSSKIVQKFINVPNSPQSVYLIVQKQFGRKLVASDITHFTSQLGMILGAEYAVKVIKNLRKTDFTPMPAVDTLCLEMKKRPTPLVPQERLAVYRKFTEDCFNDPKILAKMPLNVIGAEPGVSPSRLALERWVNLFLVQKKY